MLQNGHAIPIANTANNNNNNVFYEANGSYSPLTTCNGWTNRNLKNSGLPAVV
ncbi:DUF2459 domain-containing protein [Neisseria sp.]|uniref:DUF2459 domain-containing protein n=1 Tax=Neisseria sp. TaxID=192066 RepID=UPI00289B87CA|nr:DUF2459 domain-containing protein [Neisseria sp.]